MLIGVKSVVSQFVSELNAIFQIPAKKKPMTRSRSWGGGGESPNAGGFGKGGKPGSCTGIRFCGGAAGGSGGEKPPPRNPKKKNPDDKVL